MKRLILVFCILKGISAFAQVPHFHQIELLKKNEALQINVIYPDRVGYLWVGTNKGLFRFDGLHSIQYKKSDGLPDENVTAIAQDSIGRIWCGHKSGEISILENSHVTKFEPSEGSAAGLISDILFDHAGTLWFSTNNDGLYYYKSERLYRIDENEGLPDLFFYDLEEDKQGNIWAGSDAGIAICKLQDSKLKVELISTSDGLPDNIIHKIHQDDDGTFWIGTEDAGLIHYLPSEKKFEPQPELDLQPLNDFVIDRNKIWIATKSPGVVLFDKSTKSVSRFTDLSTVDALAKDAEGNIWYGSKKGLQRSYGNFISFLDLKDEVEDKNVFAVAFDIHGDLWFSTQSGLFVRRKIKNGNSYTIEQPLKGTAFEKLFMISLYADDEGFVWAGSYGQGLLRINTQTKSVKHFSKELRNGNILSITGKDRTVWVATLGGATKIEWQNQDFKIQNIGSPEGLSTDYIYQVFVDSEQRVWLATDGKGVNMMDNSGIHHFSDTINLKVVYGFAEDGKNQIWASVQGAGLYFFDGIKFKPQNDSLLSNDLNTDINCLTTTKHGDLLMMSNVGLKIIGIQKKLHHYLGTEQDFLEKRPNLNATAKDKEGNIYFGTENGIVMYADGVQNFSTLPVPHIESLKVSNQLIEDFSDLIFGYDENYITINYLGFWLQNPQSVSYQYKLENYDHDWIPSSDRNAIYSNLPPGDYTFKLKVSNDDSFRSGDIASIHFVIRPPFWKTYWFYGLSAIFVLFIGYSFLQYRERKLIADKHELEEKVKERTAEILKMNHEIKHQAEEIRAINDNLEKLVAERTNELNRKNKALEEAAFINAHNLRSPVASILGLINLITKLKWQDQDKEYIHHLEKSAKTLDDVVSTITQAIGKGDDLPTYGGDKDEDGKDS